MLPVFAVAEPLEPEDAIEQSLEPSPRKKKKKRKKAVPIPSGGPSRFRGAWVIVAGLYLATVWLDGVGATWPRKVTPRPWLYFAQVAALFVNAAPKVIDYRAEVWSCTDKRWTEIDTRPYFRIDADNKENRFQRALQFYRKNRTVMRELEDYIVKRETARGSSIGGVRFSSLRLPYPLPGEHVAPFEQKPLSTISGELKHEWYWTPSSRRKERCHEAGNVSAPNSSRDPRDDDDNKDSNAKDDGKDLDP